MSSEQQTVSTSDLRSAAQDSKRDAARKHKWALGAVSPTGRTEDHPRPHRPSETTYNSNRRQVKGAVASLQSAGRKHGHRLDMLEAEQDVKIECHTPNCMQCALENETASSSSADEDGDIAVTSGPNDGILYADVVRGPGHGSQILNVALAKAIEKYEDKETFKLVRKEYEVLDDDGESLGLSPVKKGKGKQRVVIVDEDEDYEFV